MSIKLPLYRQEKDNTCALACLRMVLAAFGTYVEEHELENLAHVEEEGTLIAELERIASEYNLSAEIRETTVEDLQGILSEGQFPIAYIDRTVFELQPRERANYSIRDAVIHTVVPTRVTSKLVTFNDPRSSQVCSKPIRLFRQAYLGLGGRCVVCGRRAV